MHSGSLPPTPTLSFDLETLQARITAMTDEEVAAAVLTIRQGPKGSGSGGGGAEKSPAAKEREKGKRQTQAQLLAAARDYLLAQAAAEAEQSGMRAPEGSTALNYDPSPQNSGESESEELEGAQKAVPTLSYTTEEEL